MRQIQKKTHEDSHRAGFFGLMLIALVTLVLVTLTACGGGESAPANPQVEKGKAIFSRICATCHGQDANGLPKLGKGLRNNSFTQSLSDGELVEFLKTGRPASDPLNETGVDMPPKGGDPTLTDEDLQAVVAFVRTLG